MMAAQNAQQGRLMIGRVIGNKYGVKAIIGEGGMGSVYEAEHLAIGRLVALKVLHPVNAQREDALRRFNHEARVAGSIGHPNICEVYDVGKLEDQSPYLVMERLHGRTLADRIACEGALPFADVIDILTQVLSALHAAHEKEVIHRDVKPDNIFLTERVGCAPIAKILDFGISKMGNEDGDLSLTRTGMVMGTPYYMAPEQARGDRHLDPRVDLYAVGCILYEALTGRRPFNAPNYNALLVQILTTNATPVREIRPALPEGFDEIIEQALSKHRDNRFQSAKQFLDALVSLRDNISRGPSAQELARMMAASNAKPPGMSRSASVPPPPRVAPRQPPRPTVPPPRSAPPRPTIPPAKPISSIPPHRPFPSRSSVTPTGASGPYMTVQSSELFASPDVSDTHPTGNDSIPEILEPEPTFDTSESLEMIALPSSSSNPPMPSGFHGEDTINDSFEAEVPYDVLMENADPTEIVDANSPLLQSFLQSGVDRTVVGMTIPRSSIPQARETEITLPSVDEPEPESAEHEIAKGPVPQIPNPLRPARVPGVAAYLPASVQARPPLAREEPDSDHERPAYRPSVPPPVVPRPSSFPSSPNTGSRRTEDDQERGHQRSVPPPPPPRKTPAIPPPPGDDGESVDWGLDEEDDDEPTQFYRPLKNLPTKPPRPRSNYPNALPREGGAGESWGPKTEPSPPPTPSSNPKMAAHEPDHPIHIPKPPPRPKR
jgi:serine/threonine protein kinase